MTTAASSAVSPTGPAVCDDRVVVFDTDIGYDLDDMVALWAAARSVRNLIVLTNDETRGRRAQFARALLDHMDRHDVPVVAGRELGGDHRFLLGDALIEPAVPVLTDVVEVIASECARATQPLTWVGLGPLSNLADVLTVCPHLAEQIQLTQMGGWLDHYRDPTRASHNLRMDPAAAGLVLRAAHRPRCVLSTHTNVPDIRITPDSSLFGWLTARQAPVWSQLIRANFERWFARRPASWLGDPLTLASALGEPVVDYVTEAVRIECDARLYRDPHGRAIEVSAAVDYPRFHTWLAELLPTEAWHASHAALSTSPRPLFPCGNGTGDVRELPQS
ncbi:nucleoside hydrolase [Nocardia sp. NPDC004654]|uniref:nucleoside hydrolase n=1 Tax=Nocardia sp. NPDC004654 TaxID=3154776 RepID=UPI0033B7FF12